MFKQKSIQWLAQHCSSQEEDCFVFLSGNHFTFSKELVKNAKRAKLPISRIDDIVYVGEVDPLADVCFEFMFAPNSGFDPLA